MTHQEFRILLKSLELTQIEAATFLRVRPTTVNRWARGKRKVPGPVVAALECLRERRAWEAQAESIRILATTTASTGRLTTSHVFPYRQRPRH
jgi:transcriptional regulator with XRE-family HTH domain